MAPKKASVVAVKGKKKVVIEEEEMAPESHFSEMQYPKGVIIDPGMGFTHQKEK
ncbi:hypothetical protein KI387_041381, partial [Taxus chinensis]